MKDNYTVVLRPATEADVNRLAQLHNAAAIANRTGQHVNMADLRDHVAPVELGTPGVVVAEIGEAIVGYVRLQPFREYTGQKVLGFRIVVADVPASVHYAQELLRDAKARLLNCADRGHQTTFGTWYYAGETVPKFAVSEDGFAPHRRMLEMARSLVTPSATAGLPGGLKVRPVSSADLPRIWRSLVEAMTDDAGGFAATAQAYKRWLSLPRTDLTLWKVAWADGEVVGLVLPYAQPGDDGKAASAYIEHVAVDRSWRRQGVASALLTRCFNDLRGRGLEKVSLDANETNNTGAVQLYIKNGFEVRQAITVLRKPVQ